MVVVLATGIELHTTSSTMKVSRHILLDRKFSPASSTQDGFLFLFSFQPNFYWVVRQSIMTIFAGIVQTATFHLDSNDITRPVIVRAASLAVEIDAMYGWGIREHVSRPRV